ncbi:copper transport protein ctr1 [Asimina triloba]
MEMPGRRSNYSLLTQLPDVDLQQQQQQQQQQQSKFSAAGGSGPFYESFSGEKSKQKHDRPFDWPPIDGGGGDHRRAGSLFPTPIGLQRQSSGSSFGESSLSGEYHVSTLSAANDPDLLFQQLPSPEDGFKMGVDVRLKAVDAAAAAGGSSSSRSWAQQTEESYQLQLALALRLSSEATSAEDPNFLFLGTDDSTIGTPVASAENCSQVNGCLSYYDKVPDGFYLIQGMDQYVWTVCTDLQENGRIPSIESLKVMNPDGLSVQVILFDKRSDFVLKELESKAKSLSDSCVTTKEVVDQLAKLICGRMG